MPPWLPRNDKHDLLLLQPTDAKNKHLLEPLQIESSGISRDDNDDKSSSCTSLSSCRQSIPIVKDSNSIVHDGVVSVATNTSHHHKRNQAAKTTEEKDEATTLTGKPPSQPATTLHQHLVLPTDTLAGLLLTYRVSKQALRRANPGCILHDAVQAGDRLYIPTAAAAAVPPRQDESAKTYKVAAVLEQCRYLTLPQAESYLSRNHWNVRHAVQQAKAVRDKEEQETARKREQARQRKQDAVEFQRILWHHKKQALLQQQNGESTELTRLTMSTSSLYLDEPNENEKHNQQPSDDQGGGCVGACCSLVCLVVFEWIRHSIPFVQQVVQQ